MTETPKVGIGVIILKDNKVLIGKRIGSHGENTWSFPGGHLERFETFKSCALRETKEETDLDIQLESENPVAITNDMFNEENKHYITLFLKAKIKSGEPKIMEPNKCLKWKWVEWNKLPKDLFLPIKNLIKQGHNPIK